MKKLIVSILILAVLGVILQVRAVPVIPPIPEPTPSPSPSPEPGPGGSPVVERQQKFEIISAEPILEGHAGGTIHYDLKTIQKGYPDLVVHLKAEIPHNWKAAFSKNDFDLNPDESVELVLSLSLPETLSVEKNEIKIRAVGKAKEDSLEVEDAVTVTAMTYMIDVGITYLQVSPLKPEVGDSVTVAATCVNYTQRITPDVIVEFLVNNGLTSRQTVTLTAGASQVITFVWTAESGTTTFLVRSQTQGDSNHRNDSVSQKVSIGSGVEEINALFQQASTLYDQGAYNLARDLFAVAAAQYTGIGELEKAAEAERLRKFCNSYMEAQNFMDLGEQALLEKNYEQAAQYFEKARDLYTEIGDTGKQNYAQDRLDEALAFRIPYVGILAVSIVVVVSLAVLLSMRKKYPTSPQVVPEELVQFQQKTEDALRELTREYVDENLQQAMQFYFSLEGERKQLQGKNSELEQIIDANLRELEQRIFAA